MTPNTTPPPCGNCGCKWHDGTDCGELIQIGPEEGLWCECDTYSPDPPPEPEVCECGHELKWHLDGDAEPSPDEDCHKCLCPKYRKRAAKIIIEKDGDAWCCKGPTFTDLQSSDDFAFGDSPDKAVANYFADRPTRPDVPDTARGCDLCGANLSNGEHAKRQCPRFGTFPQDQQFAAARSASPDDAGELAKLAESFFLDTPTCDRGLYDWMADFAAAQNAAKDARLAEYEEMLGRARYIGLGFGRLEKLTEDGLWYAEEYGQSGVVLTDFATALEAYQALSKEQK